MARERLNRGIIVKYTVSFPAAGKRISCCIRSYSRYSSPIVREARLSETEDWSFGGRRAIAGARPPVQQVSFDRRELGAILQVYGRQVAAGEWRDYAIDHLADRAVFSIFRRTSEMPMFRVEKVPALARKQGAYRVVAATGLIMKRGQELKSVLKVLEKPKLSLVHG